MSLILDALNRSRQDADQVPGLTTQHYESPQTTQTRGWRKWAPWAGLGAALLVIAWLLLDRGGQPPAEIAPAPPEQTEVAPAKVSPGPAAAPEPAPTALTPEAPIAPAVQPAREALVESPQAVPATTPDSAVTALYERSEVQAPAAPAPERTAAAPVEEPVRPEKEVQEEPVDIEALVAQAREEMENARLAEHLAPFVTELSQQTKNDIPTIFYQRHDYRGDSAASTVVLNGEELGVGGRPAPGVKVDEILPDSVVLSYQGTQFRLRALNSWVNL